MSNSVSWVTHAVVGAVMLFPSVSFGQCSQAGGGKGGGAKGGGGFKTGFQGGGFAQKGGGQSQRNLQGGGPMNFMMMQQQQAQQRAFLQQQQQQQFQQQLAQQQFQQQMLAQQAFQQVIANQGMGMKQAVPNQERVQMFLQQQAAKQTDAVLRKAINSPNEMIQHAASVELARRQVMEQIQNPLTYQASYR